MVKQGISLQKRVARFSDFEGNANGFTVLTGTRPGIEGVFYFLCYTRAFMKYQESLPKKPTSNIADKSMVSFKQIKNSLKM
jgi:dGTPase